MRLFLLLFLALGAVALRSQSPPAEIPPYIIKTNATTLLNPFKQAVMLTADIRIAPRWSVDIGGGAFLYGVTFVTREGDSYRGGRWRAGFKYFTRRTDTRSFHLGLEFKYNDITHVQSRTALRQGGQYLEILPVERTVRTAGVAARIGSYRYLGKKRRLLIEPYWGLGYAVHRVARHLPPDAELVDGAGRRAVSIEYEPGQTVTPDILWGVHMGWLIR